MSKVCKRCEDRKPLSSFEKCRNGAGGKFSYRNVCHRCRKGLAAVVPEIPEPPPKRFFRALTGKRFLITSAQNNTDVHQGFLASLKQAAEFYKAEIVVIPYRYKNPTSQAENHSTALDYEWADELQPYLHNVRKKLNDNLILCADVKTQPTATHPLSSLEGMTGAESCIIGHPKMQFKAIAVPSGKYPKILTTTGACTVRDYSDTKAGAIGKFHHFLGAIIVEVVNNREFHVRQINANRQDGSFTDWAHCFTPTGVTKAPRAKSLRCGDTHVRVTCPDVDAATFGKNGIVEQLDPETLIFDDVFDGETVNPHEEGDLFLVAARAKEHRTDVRAELQQVVEFLNARAGNRNVVIVDSNHHDFLRRWVVKTLNRGCHDPRNVRLFAESVVHMYDTALMTPGGAEYGDPFQYWMKKMGLKANIRCLERDESFVIMGVENGLHGNDGPNGAKGSVQNLSKLGVRVNSGHGHTPAIEGGHYRSGTSTPRRQSYHRGPNSNLNTHILQYANGARCLVTIIGRKFRLS